MRLLIAMMKHETNTFSPVATPQARFGPLYGEAAICAYRGTGTGLGAYLGAGLWRAGETLGVLEVMRQTGHRFSDAEERLLVSLANDGPVTIIIDSKNRAPRDRTPCSRKATSRSSTSSKSSSSSTPANNHRPFARRHICSRAHHRHRGD